MAPSSCRAPPAGRCNPRNQGRWRFLARNDTQGGTLAGKVFLPCLFSVSQLFLSLPSIPTLTQAWAQETVAAPCSGIGTLVHTRVEHLPVACAICPCCPPPKCWAVLHDRGQHRDLHEKQQLDPAIRLTPAAGKGWVNRPRPWVASPEQVTAVGWDGTRSAGFPHAEEAISPRHPCRHRRLRKDLGGTYLDERAWTAAGWGCRGAPHGAVPGPTHLPRAGSAAPYPFPAAAGNRGADSRRSNKRCEERRRRERRQRC